MKMIYFTAILIMLFFIMLEQVHQYKNTDGFVPDPNAAPFPGKEKIQFDPIDDHFRPVNLRVETALDSLRIQPKITASFPQTQPN